MATEQSTTPATIEWTRIFKGRTKPTIPVGMVAPSKQSPTGLVVITKMKFEFLSAAMAEDFGAGDGPRWRVRFTGIPSDAD